MTYYIIYFYSNLFKRRDIKCIQELSKSLVKMCQAIDLNVAYSLQNINIVCFVKFRHCISEHRDTVRKLERINLSFKTSFRIRRNLTLTNPCQSDNLARPSLIRPKRRGTFFKPLRWLCIALEVATFSERKKQATASCRERMTEIEREGRSSQVRKSDLPIVVFVSFKMPKDVG